MRVRSPILPPGAKVVSVADRYSRLVDVGRFALECGNPELAETVLLQSLSHADGYFGEASDISRCIINDLLGFYARQGNSDEFTRLQERLISQMPSPAVPE